MQKTIRRVATLFLSLGLVFSCVSVKTLTVSAETNPGQTLQTIPTDQSAENEKFTVFYDGGSADVSNTVSEESYTVGVVPSVTETVPVKEGYRFEEWNTAEDGSGDVYFSGDKIDTVTDITLYAQWTDESSIPSRGTRHLQTLKTKYMDYLITAEGDLPEGASLKIGNIETDSSITEIIQAKISAELTPLVYFNGAISIIYDGSVYQSNASDIKVTVKGPVLRSKLTGRIALFQGKTDLTVSEEEAAVLTDSQAEFMMDGSCVTAVADLTENVPEHPVSGYIPEEKRSSAAAYSSAKASGLTASASAGTQESLTYEKSYANRILPIRDQGSYGDCWAVSTTTLVELSAIQQVSNKAALASSINLSELQLAYFTYHQTGYDPLGLTNGDTVTYAATANNSNNFLMTGGDYSYPTLALMNWMGLVDENKYPELAYNTANAERILSNGLSTDYQYAKDAYHVEDVYTFDISSSSGKELAKKYITENGGIGIAFYATNGQKYLNGASYYCYDEQYANHAVTVVGWDDDYAASNFSDGTSLTSTPSSNGAWLVRNSWGGSNTADSYDGYFWLSYEDKSLEQYAYSVKTGTADNYDNNYQYDGTISPFNYDNWTSSFSAANVFTAKANSSGSELLKAVSIGLDSENVNYTLSIYTNLTSSTNPVSGTLAATQTGTAAEGQHTIVLNTPVQLYEGQKYSVVFNLATADGSVLYVQAEGDTFTYLYNVKVTASAEANQGFISAASNNSGTWSDFLNMTNTWGSYSSYLKNLRIKAYTDNSAAPTPPSYPLKSISLNQTSLNFQAAGKQDVLSVSYNPANTTDSTAIVWSSSDSRVATVNNGIVTAVGNGTAVITATALNNITASCTVTVSIPIPMYRLYNPNSGEHFYTANAVERDNVAAAGWKYEGIGWYAPPSGKPVYRLYNQYGGEHHYTLSAAEKDMLVSAGWTLESSSAWYSDVNESIPLYRQYNPNQYSCNHNYTVSKAENDWLVSLGWRAEGISWYGVKEPS